MSATGWIILVALVIVATWIMRGGHAGAGHGVHGGHGGGGCCGGGHSHGSTGSRARERSAADRRGAPAEARGGHRHG